MLIKEYRIPLPLTVEEYRIAQLYMIAKKSREESSGAGSGVEILVNEPYSEGPGGQGQYTHKIYHVGSHLPGWLKGILPKTALMVDEEAWNAYPYTKTRYTCPFVEKFYLEIETYYFGDNGHQENVFKLSGSDLRNRTVDLIDMVKDQLYGTDYLKDEDPKLFVSEKTGRGPLAETWLDDYWNDVRGKTQPTPDGKSLMCAYKLCRVEFRYWGMQTKIERFIHDVALRKTMVRAHRQAWAWQDEWHGLTMEDIREIERQTQLALKRKMAQANGEDVDDDFTSTNGGGGGNILQDSSTAKNLVATFGSIEKPEDVVPGLLLTKADSDVTCAQPEGGSDIDLSPDDVTNEMNLSLQRGDDKWQQRSLHSPGSSSIKSFDLQVANWRIESLGRDSDTASDEEFFDCQENITDTSLAKWSSLDLLNEEDTEATSPNNVSSAGDEDSIFSPSFLQRVTSERGNHRRALHNSKGRANSSVDTSCPDSPCISPAHLPCSTTVLVLVMHAGSVLDANVDVTAKKSDVTTFRGAFESVMRQHYPTLVGHVAIKLVSCQSICCESLGILSSLSPYSFDVSPSSIDMPSVTNDSIPIGAIPLLATSTSEYQDAVSRTINSANLVYQEFLKTEEGIGFTGQVCLVADSVGSILTYDALCRVTRYRSRHGSENSILDTDIIVLKDDLQINESGHLIAPSPRRRSSSTSDQGNQIKFEFEVSDFFMFGSPLALVLAYRKISTDEKGSSASIMRPNCLQVYNMFHPTDPIATRIEPLLSARFSILPPINVARYVKYPLGDGQPYHLLQQKWWGGKRVDYALYCPEGLSNFPTNALPHLFHASYWESYDVIAFVLRQLSRQEILPHSGIEEREPCFRPGQPREKWIRKRTSVKLKNVAANHRANDVIVREGASQSLLARFMYGPLDMITLTGEKVDIHVMKDVPSGEWMLMSTEVTDKTGRVVYTIPEEKSLNYGLYPIKMVVRGDHTTVDFFLAVVPPKTECVVFSIDGSFTASMSVTGRDPKVRAGAVDVVRHWQELGYLIIYITGRPDMQQQKVVSWLSQHNFPHGLVSFADGLSTDPLGHKAAYLINLVQNHGVCIHSAYGSAKDISVYMAVGLKPKQIYIVGKASKKQHTQATVLAEGYATHLTMLMAHGGSRPAQGNARMVIPRGHFGLPGQSYGRRRSSKTTSSKRPMPLPPPNDSGGSHLLLERSMSARRCQLPRTTLGVVIGGNHTSVTGGGTG